MHGRPVGWEVLNGRVVHVDHGSLASLVVGEHAVCGKVVQDDFSCEGENYKQLSRYFNRLSIVNYSDTIYHIFNHSYKR